ncbi:MAG: ferredoxin [Xanthobacteraceae bacterium]|jgi:ferredoxin|nr:ferredoxin [Xanthobacteraceae bacterium]MBV9631920.1 ferredoxin [Xanthobacteraceae bacterium]
MRDKTRLFARIVGERCQGHARCVAIAPELFELDELGNAHARLHGLVPKGLEAKAWLAKANCPELALDILEQ